MIAIAVPESRHQAEVGQARASAAAIGTGVLFELLADSTRRCRLVGALDLPQPKVSRHLAAMREAGLLVSRRKGTWILYRFDPQVPGWAMRVIGMMGEGARGEPEHATDSERLSRLALCGENVFP